MPPLNRQTKSYAPESKMAKGSRALASQIIRAERVGWGCLAIDYDEKGFPVEVPWPTKGGSR